MRAILHVDLNNFYASVECLENPQLKNKTVVVCGDAKNRHGVVLAKNQKAKQLGIKTGMVIWEAQNIDRNLVVINARFNLYLKYSQRVRNIFNDFTDRIEPYGIDESWLDVTESISLLGSPHHIAYLIKERIKNEIGLTVSVGLSDNKIYAKLASDIAGVDEIFEINSNNKFDLIYPQKVENILYVGSATKKKLNKLGINTIGQLANSDVKVLKNYLGKWGEYLFNFASGQDTSEVKKFDYKSKFKSIGNSLTNYKDIISDNDVLALIFILSESVVFRAKSEGIKRARGVSVWVRNSELVSQSFQRKIAPSLLISDIAYVAFDLIKQNYDYNHKIRAIGISIFNFTDDGQLGFIDAEKIEKQYLLDDALIKIKNKYGNSAINRAVVAKDKRLNALNIKDEHIIHPVSYFKK